VKNLESLFEVEANTSTTINLGLIEDAEGDMIVVKEFKVKNSEFLDFIKLVNTTDSKDPELMIEVVNPPESLTGNQTTIFIVLADQNWYNAKEEFYTITVSVIAGELEPIEEPTEESADQSGGAEGTTG